MFPTYPLVSLTDIAVLLFLIACKQLYKSMCWSVGPSVHFSYFTFFGVFKQLEGRKVRPTNRLTDTVTYKLSCTTLMAIGLFCFLAMHLQVRRWTPPLPSISNFLPFPSSPREKSSFAAVLFVAKSE